MLAGCEVGRHERVMVEDHHELDDRQGEYKSHDRHRDHQLDDREPACLCACWHHWIAVGDGVGVGDGGGVFDGVGGGLGCTVGLGVGVGLGGSVAVFDGDGDGGGGV